MSFVLFYIQDGRCSAALPLTPFPSPSYSPDVTPDTRATTVLPAAARLRGFSYAIRNIVSAAAAIEKTGRRVRYLNIGDPVQYGFDTPPHLVEAVVRALRDGRNGYVSSAGIPEARQAIANDYTRRGVRLTPERVFVTAGTSEGIDLALSAIVDPGDDVLVPVPTYPLYTAVLAKLGARPNYYRLDPSAAWQPDLDDLRARITDRTRALVVIDPNNPTGAIYPERLRRDLLELADRRGLVLIADEVYGDLAFDGPVPPIASLDDRAPVLSVGSLSKGYLAPGWRTGWVAVADTDRLADVLAAIQRLADGRVCSPGPPQSAIAAALTGDRSHQDRFRSALRERAELTSSRLNAIPGISCVPPKAAFYAMPRAALPPGLTDERFVLDLLAETGILVVYGSGFGMPASAGYFRVVFLPSLEELSGVYADLARFAAGVLTG